MSDDITVENLWVETAANRLRFEAVARKLGGRSGDGPYVLVLAVVLVHIPLLSLLGFWTTGTLSMAENPGELFQLPAWIAVVWILLKTKRTYSNAVEDLPESFDEDVQNLDIESPLTARLLSVVGVPERPSGKRDARLEEIAPDRLKYGVLLGGWVLYGSQLVTNPGGLVGPVIDLTGPVVAGVRFLVIIPFVFYPLGAELLAVIVGALLLLPFKIRRARLVDFSDPKGFGGLVSTGKLFKSVAVSYFVLLALFTLFETVAVGTEPTQLLSSAFIVGGVGAGLVFFFAPMVWMRSYISAAKEAKIRTLSEATRSVGSTDELLPYAEPESSADTNRYVFNHIRMQRVEATKEFPVNIGMVYEVLVALVLPYLTSLSVDLLFS